ncbi:hypothetical protein SAMN04488125_11853 [Methylorubrum salsuginis]|uniref:Uncharacterized protein n=1 Tax=Methylorubrum salsuginis TaxID=414703 RepID=A0A1I4ITL0_9HYPH|nr:hypothetical protein SAMN04488125_11853 [Methylorubrum salsuginis]
MAGCLLTLACVQTLLIGAANASVGIFSTKRDELDAQTLHAGQYQIVGAVARLTTVA